MTKWIKMALVLMVTVTINAQNRQDLENQRTRLLKQIETSQQLLSRTRAHASSQLNQIETISAQVRLQEDLLDVINEEVIAADEGIAQCNSRIAEISDRREQLLNTQGEMLRISYLQSRTISSRYFLFSAANLNEAFARWRFLRAMSSHHLASYHQLQADQDSIRTAISMLEDIRQSKQNLIEEGQKKRRELENSRRTEENILVSLKQQEKQLRDRIAISQAESKRLADEIASIIARETEKITSESTSMPNAPVVRRLSGAFAANKGALPWPVNRGVITGKFGEQPHPVLKRITIKNNGIDITTPDGEKVRAIFDGQVVGRTSIPGFDNMIIVQHGEYFTVYSRLAKVRVRKGDELQTGQIVGTLARGQEENPRLHLEIWHHKTQLDPLQWIAR